MRLWWVAPAMRWQWRPPQLAAQCPGERRWTEIWLIGCSTRCDTRHSVYPVAVHISASEDYIPCDIVSHNRCWNRSHRDPRVMVIWWSPSSRRCPCRQRVRYSTKLSGLTLSLTLSLARSLGCSVAWLLVLLHYRSSLKVLIVANN